TWDGSSCHPRAAERLGFVTFYGDSGSLAVGGDDSYRVLDLRGREVGRGRGPGGDRAHFADFFDCVHSGRRPHADIEEGQKSTLMCHLGNIAYRTGRTLTVDPETRAVVNDRGATALLGREYRKGWEPKV